MTGLQNSFAGHGHVRDTDTAHPIDCDGLVARNRVGDTDGAGPGGLRGEDSAGGRGYTNAVVGYNNRGLDDN